tara:strand:- start:239 stop:610 length:372 start_codon:yes stop_codon:yes gene_type:complete
MNRLAVFAAVVLLLGSRSPLPEQCVTKVVTFKGSEHPLLEDSWRCWENGRRKRAGKMKGGEQEGDWAEWYENGQKHWQGTLRHGQEEGLWTYWHENGTKRRLTRNKKQRWLIDVAKRVPPRSI